MHLYRIVMHLDQSLFACITFWCPQIFLGMVPYWEYHLLFERLPITLSLHIDESVQHVVSDLINLRFQYENFPTLVVSVPTPPHPNLLSSQNANRQPIEVILVVVDHIIMFGSYTNYFVCDLPRVSFQLLDQHMSVDTVLTSSQNGKIEDL